MDTRSPLETSLLTASDEHCCYRSFDQQNFTPSSTSADNETALGPYQETKMTLLTQFQAIICFSWLNILLLAVPIGFALNHTHVNEIANFWMNFLAMIPLAGILGFTADQVTHYIGELFGGLLLATFGNAPELIISILALRHGEVVIVQTSLVGSILSNILLVLGMAFSAACIQSPSKAFNKTIARVSLSLISLCIGTLLILARCFPTLNGVTETAARASYGISILWICLYCCYFYFQLKHLSTTQEMADDETGPAQDETASDHLKLTATVAVISLLLTTALIAFHAEFLVRSFGSFTMKAHIPERFVGLILIPIIGNAAEHMTAVIMAFRHKVNLAIGIALGSGVQVATFLFPVIVLVGWMMGVTSMTLVLDDLQCYTLLVSLLVLFPILLGSDIHRFSGLPLLFLYGTIAIIAFFYT